MKKNIALIVLTLTTIVSVTGWMMSKHEANSNAITMHSEAQIISKTIGHKQKNLSLKNDDTIKTQNFEVEYHDQGDGDYTLVVVPTDKSQKIVGQQGEGADGIELVNVKK
ncbi:hypothetical protein CBG04_08460 [Limosilactobacillus reuteri]|uniref:hypothetical protein n=1 Tax=Limosilactobacillus reuteri TaxID=1598 RepID=UPI000B9989EA|nr:hypothetical protein [Limosilactobacillus reuteri]OYS80564.1 hypothetical protein CBG11_06955 [Limosilactobacillus reuteri]OYS82449.1 hypothetical protein CBG04_08460 [Limosilactobacillus reuteri]OYS83004.1 hypothetical protein CBG14_08960 [Limosilactobacillus reuteri]